MARPVMLEQDCQNQASLQATQQFIKYLRTAAPEKNLYKTH